MKLITVFEHDELRALQPSILIESWRNVMQCGSKRRKYYESFNEKEREIIQQQYKVFGNWHFKTGIPQKHAMPIHIYQLMNRATNFFGTIK